MKTFLSVAFAGLFLGLCWLMLIPLLVYFEAFLFPASGRSVPRTNVAQIIDPS